MGARRANQAHPRDPRVKMAAFDRAMFNDAAERALFAINDAADLDDDEPELPGLSAAQRAELEARADAMTDEEIIEAAVAGAAVPLPDFDLTDSQCIDVAALLAPYVPGGEER